MEPTEPPPEPEPPAGEKGKKPKEKAPAAPVTPPAKEAPEKPEPEPTEPPAEGEPAPAEPTPPEGEPTPAEAEPPPAEGAPEGEEEEDLGGFEVVDLTEDEEAAAAEMKVEQVEVKGASGTLKGRILDSTTGEPLIGANVTVVGTKYKAKADLDGNFELPLPPGKYELRIWADAYQARRVSQVVIEKDGERTINSELEPLEGAVQTVVVEAEANKESEGARLDERKKAVGSRDIMSRDEIKKSGGGSTSAVARRIVGATVVGGKYLFVRGLGHRYGNTLFDGARVPSPEPELRTVPLDVFPSGALSAINVQKTFTPDVPADFAGGSTQLESRNAPEEFLLDVGVSMGVNTRTIGQTSVYGDHFPGADAFAFGNVPRGLPAVIPRDQRAGFREQDDQLNPLWTPEQIERYGESMFTKTRIRRRDGLPNLGGKLTLGHGFKPWGTELGVVWANTYSNGYKTLRETIRVFSNQLLDPDDPDSFGINPDDPRTDYTGIRTTQSTSWSSLGLVKWKLNDDHRLSLSGMYTRDADSEAREYDGTTRSQSQPVQTTRHRYTMRSIAFTELKGGHVIPRAKNLEIDWFGSYSQARNDQPAIREMLFRESPNGLIVDEDNAASFLYLNLVDHVENGAVDFTMPFKQWGGLESKVKIGTWLEGKQRLFLGRRFQFQFNSQGGTLPTGTGNILNDDTIGGGISVDDPAAFALDELSKRKDSYEASQEIYAAYGLLEIPLVRWMKIAGGARFEFSEMDVSTYDPFDEDADIPDEEKARIVDKDVLPSASIIFPIRSDMNVRLSGSQTLARPEFRELAPFTFTDFVGGFDVVGNPKLVTTHVWNADLRWEWFVSSAEVVALSVFYKHFDEPIERVVAARGTPLASFKNADAANNIGAEVELRKNLEFFAGKPRGDSEAAKRRNSQAKKVLSDFSLGANFAYIYSQVKLRPPQDCTLLPPEEIAPCEAEAVLDVSTSRSRPLADQSPWVINAYFSYDNDDSGSSARVLYNTFGRRIAFVGAQGLPDIYQEPIHGLDFVFSQRLYDGLSLSFSARNLLDWPNRQTQGDDRIATYRAREGIAFGLGLNYSF